MLTLAPGRTYWTVRDERCDLTGDVLPAGTPVTYLRHVAFFALAPEVVLPPPAVSPSSSKYGPEWWTTADNLTDRDPTSGTAALGGEP